MQHTEIPPEASSAHEHRVGRDRQQRALVFEAGPHVQLVRALRTLPTHTGTEGCGCGDVYD